jgi:signal transduction histidine kinase
VTIPPSDPARDFEDFIYLISHDVRNSVRALIELPQWIVENLAHAGVRIDGSVAESIELMNRHTGRLDRMLVDLLTYSRVGRMQEVVEVELDVALTEVLDELHVPPDFEISHALDANRVVMGERDVLTLLSALLTNAIKHHHREDGRMLISSSEKAGFVSIRVSDDGPGIPEKFRAKVFGAMTTLRPRDEVEGSGMGLALVQKIARHYGGDASLSAGISGAGTTVEVLLPRVQARTPHPASAM